MKRTRASAITSDAHFWLPVAVLVLGIVLLVIVQ